MLASHIVIAVNSMAYRSVNTFSLCPEKNWINTNSHVLTSVAVHFSSAPSPKAETHQLRQCKLAHMNLKTDTGTGDTKWLTF